MRYYDPPPTPYVVGSGVVLGGDEPLVEDTLSRVYEVGVAAQGIDVSLFRLLPHATTLSSRRSSELIGTSPTSPPLSISLLPSQCRIGQRWLAPVVVPAARGYVTGRHRSILPQAQLLRQHGLLLTFMSPLSLHTHFFSLSLSLPNTHRPPLPRLPAERLPRPPSPPAFRPPVRLPSSPCSARLAPP